MERDRSHSQASNDGSVTSLVKRESPPCQQDADDDSHGSKRITCSWLDLPEEIWHHIHSLVPMREAARAACVSHAFLHSWRCHTNLTFTMETICSKESLREGFEDPIDVSEFNNNIDHILVNHSTVGVKTLILKLHGPYGAKCYNRLDSWLKIAVTPMIEELTLVLRLWTEEITYNFPCSLLSDMSGNTLRYLRLDRCVLRPTSELGLKSLTMLHLRKVHITGDELGCRLSDCLALEQLKLRYCDDIICLAIPCLLQRFSYLEVFECESLQVIENKVPNLSSFCFTSHQIQLSLGEYLKLKKLKLYHKCAIRHAIDKLPSCVPNLETLTIHSFSEVSKKYMYDWLQGYPSSLRQMPVRHHGNLKNVKITGFRPHKKASFS